jgi:hypothetical protein
MKLFDEISAAAPAMRSGVMTAALTAWRGVKAWIAIGLALSIMTMPDAHARIYKWVDADGNVQYSQTPPPEGQFNEVNPGPPPSESPEEANQQLQDTLQRQEESEKQDEADKMEKKETASKQAKKDEICDKAR